MSSVDSQPPVITLPQSWPLGRSADYTVADPSAGSGQAGSGLSSVRVVITDQQERYPKVHWDEAASGAAFESVIEWDGLWADKSKARPGEYLAWVKAADNAGNESFAVGKIRVEGKNPLSGTGAPVITLPSLPTATALPPVPASHPSTGSGQALTPGASPLIPDTSHPTPFGGQTASSQVTSQTTRFHPPTKPSPIQNRKSEIANLWWGGAAAGAAGAFLAESLRRKKEREKRLEDYQNRPKIEQEGKGGHLTGKQIAKAYQAAMQQKRQQEAAVQAARNQAIAAKLTRMEADAERQWQQAHPPKPAFDPAKWKQQDYAESARWEAQQAYLRYRQGEWVNPQAAAEKPWWQRAWDGITTTTQKVTSAISSAVAGVLHPPQTGSYKLDAPVKDGPSSWWERLLEKGKELLQPATEKIVAAKRWFTGEDVGYTNSGWGHGPRQWVANRLGLDNSVGNVFTLVSRSLLQYDKVNLDGSLLQKIQADPVMKELEKSIVIAAKSNPKYGIEAFSIDEWEEGKTYEFGSKRAPGDMWEQLRHPLSGLRGNTIEYIQTHGLLQTVKDLIDPKKDVIRLNYGDTWKVGFNELTWATRHATVTAQVQVSEQGEIHIEYHLQDELDLEPEPKRSTAYNTITSILGKLYHDILGGNNQMQVEAQWSSDR